MKVSSFDEDLEFLFKTYYRRLVYFSFQIVANKESAEDIVQEVFLKFYNQKEEIDSPIESFKSYLYSAVKNVSLNAVRHQRVTEKYKGRINFSEVEEDVILNAIMRAEVIGELHAAIQSLPEGCQKVSRLSFLEEKKNQEIAEELGISITTVKSQKQRALQLLRLRLTPEIYSCVLFLLVRE
jgi:RNA polymerase sigma-70 factor (family 1)